MTKIVQCNAERSIYGSINASNSIERNANEISVDAVEKVILEFINENSTKIITNSKTELEELNHANHIETLIINTLLYENSDKTNEVLEELQRIRTITTNDV